VIPGHAGQFQDVEIPEDGAFRALQLGGDLLDAIATPSLDEFQDAEDSGEAGGLLEPPVGLGASGMVIIRHRRSVLRTGSPDRTFEVQ
jgi:hypothetical protein